MYERECRWTIPLMYTTLKLNHGYYGQYDSNPILEVMSGPAWFVLRGIAVCEIGSGIPKWSSNPVHDGEAPESKTLLHHYCVSDNRYFPGSARTVAINTGDVSAMMTDFLECVRQIKVINCLTQCMTSKPSRRERE